MFDRNFTEFYAGTKRIKEYEIKDALNDLDDAYFALETDEQTLKDADRPLINDTKKAQELIFNAIDKLQDLQDHGFTEMDHMIWDLKDLVQRGKNLKLEVNTVEPR